MSLPSEIIQLFGTSSVPAIVGGSVLGVFELGERLASQRAKDALSKWLLSFDVQRAKMLPDGTQELFERIFGERHFSLKCFGRSVAFSLGAIAFIAIVCLLINPHPSQIFTETSFVLPGRRLTIPALYYVIICALWLPWSIVIDYVSLFKTRLILGLLLRMHRGTTIVAIAILAVDYIAYKIIFFGSLILVNALPLSLLSVNAFSMAWDLVKWGFLDGDFGSLLLAPKTISWQFILFWAGFAPSLWMWLYVLALFVTRGLLRSERIVNWLRWFFDVEKAPFRSIGAVAATLAFIVSVAIILVSAEVSRISAA